RFSLVDVPDLKLLPQLWPTLREIWIGAGPVPAILHRALNGLAWLVRLGMFPTIEPLAFMLHGVINRLRWGEHRGGMYVCVSGKKDGRQVTRSWHLLAEGDAGPFIPSMGVEAIVRKRLAGWRPAPGARPAIHDLELDDYQACFVGRAIFTG